MRMSLFVEEAESLAQYEEAIAAGLATDFLRVGEALSAISRRKLYRETHRTFEDYCRMRWGLPRATAYQKIPRCGGICKCLQLQTFAPGE